jgi:hypothetical protein
MYLGEKDEMYKEFHCPELHPEIVEATGRPVCYYFLTSLRLHLRKPLEIWKIA